MPASTPPRRPAWLLVAIALQSWPLVRALETLRTIATQWREWFFILGPGLGAFRLLYAVVSVLAFGAAMVGLWRRRGWGWTLAFAADLAGLAFAVFGMVANPRPDVAVPAALYAVALAVLLLTPLRDSLSDSRSPVVAWWDREPEFDRRMAGWIGIGLAAVCAYYLLSLAVASYAAPKANALLFAILGVCTGLILAKARGVPAYLLAILWFASLLVVVARFIAEDPARHHIGSAWPLVACCIAAGLCLTLALAHELHWQARSGDAAPRTPETPPSAEPSEIISSEAPAGGNDRQDRLSRARGAVLRQAWLSMALLAPVVLMQTSFTTGTPSVAGAKWLGHFLAPAGLAIALAGIELAFVLIVARLRNGAADPVAGAIAAGAGILWLSLAGLVAIAGVLPIGPYGVPWAVFLLQPAGLVVLPWLVLFVRAQRILVREGDVLCAGAGGRASLAEHSLARLLPLACLLGALTIATVLHRQARMYAERAHSRSLEAYRRAHPPRPLPPPLPKLVQLWCTPPLPSHAFGQPVTPALMRDGTIIVALDSELVAVAPNGSVVWHNDAVHAAAQTPVIDASGTIYVAGRGDSLYAVAPDGTRRWAAYIGRHGAAVPDSLLPPAVTRSAIWARARDGSLVRVSKDGRITGRAPLQETVTPPAVHPDGSISVVALSGTGFAARNTLVRLDADGRIVSRVGMQRWSGPDAPPAIDRNGDAYIVDARDLLRVPAQGTARRVSSVQAIVDGSVSIARDGVGRIIVTTAGLLSSLSPDGALQWSTAMKTRAGEGEWIVGGAAPASNGRLVVSTTSRVVVVGMADGAPVTDFDFEPWVYTEHGGYTPSPAARPVIGPDGVIYVVDTGLRLHALRDTVSASKQ